MAVAIDSESHNELKRQLAQCEADGERMAAELERLRSTIRAFGRGDIVPITDKDAEIERLRAALQYVLDDEPNLIPRATSSCRAHIRGILEQKETPKS